MMMAMVALSGAMRADAATKISISDDEYNLYVDEYPDGIGEGIYAKTKSAKKDIDDYYLNLSSDESEEKFASAVNKAGISTKGKLLCSMDAALYKITDDEDKKVTDTVEVLLPVPDDVQEYPEEAVLYMVSGGTAKPVSATLVECDEVYYNQFTISNYTTYGYVYTDPDTLEGEEEENTPTPTKEAEPTKKPTATPTPEVTKKPTTTPKATPTADPTKTPGKKDDGKGGDSGKTGTKDSVPKTGDDFSYLRYILIGACAIGIITWAGIKLKK